MIKTKHQPLGNLQIVRAVAAILVVVWHLRDIARNFIENFELPANLQFGMAGVDIFFVLSGFIILYVTPQKNFNWKIFSLKRAIRIFPIFLAITTLVLIAYLLNPEWTLGMSPPTFGSIIQSFLIFPQAKSPLLFVAWSLEHELIFYAIVCIFGALGIIRHAIWAVAFLFAVGIVREKMFPGFWDYHLFSLFHFEFLLGMAIYQYRDYLDKLGVLVPLAVGIGLLFSGAPFVPHSPHNPNLLRVIIYGTAGALILISALNFEVEAKTRTAVGRYLVRLGDASYLLYLVHPLVISIVAKLVLVLGNGIFYCLGAIVVSLICCVEGSLFLHRVIERPVTELLRQKLMTSKLEFGHSH